MSKRAFRCENCGHELIVEEGSAHPECCGLPMKEIALEDCTKPMNAESARLDDEDGACDDGVK